MLIQKLKNLRGAGHVLEQASLVALKTQKYDQISSVSFEDLKFFHRIKRLELICCPRGTVAISSQRTTKELVGIPLTELLLQTLHLFIMQPFDNDFRTDANADTSATHYCRNLGSKSGGKRSGVALQAVTEIHDLKPLHSNFENPLYRTLGNAGGSGEVCGAEARLIGSA